MLEQFVDRQSAYPNRYKITRGDGSIEYVTIERADEPSVAGTILNAETLNKIVNGLNAVDLESLLAAGPMILKEGEEYHYGDTLPTAGTKGRIFFKKVNA